MAVVGHIIVFIMITRDKFCDGDEGVIAEPTVEKAKHRWRITEGSIAAEEAIIGDEAAPRFANEGCTDDFFHILDL